MKPNFWMQKGVYLGENMGGGGERKCNNYTDNSEEVQCYSVIQWFSATVFKVWFVNPLRSPGQLQGFAKSNT